MATFHIRRNDLRGFLNHVTDARPDGKPIFPFFSACGPRRQPLYLRYEPMDATTNGPLARVGDFNLLEDRDQRGLHRVIRNGDNVYQLEASQRRRGEKIILEDAGTDRWMVIKNWDRDRRPQQPTKHWNPQGSTLNYNPSEKGLYLVQGAYNDLMKHGRIGRYGQWRPFCQLDLRTLHRIRVNKNDYVVV